MSELPIAEGQVVAGKYRVERLLGSGAMGVVVSAWHEELQQRVAVKFVRPEAMTLRDAEERFRREARAAARIRSEHVGRVVDVGTLAGGVPFMVMEFLDGNDLADELARRGPLPVAEAAGYVLQAIEALSEAHAAGIIHRDLKPANLFLARRPDGSRILKVLDFGVSKAASSQSELALTQSAAMIGSPLYMSPEQMRSARDVDARADVWSLGVILYELIAGTPPFLGDSLTELMNAMLEPPRSLRSLRPELPESISRIVACCLERDPAARFPDVASLGQALSELAPEFRFHAERARRVLGGSQGGAAPRSSVPTSGQVASSTPPVAPARPTLAAWGDSRAATAKRPRARRIALGVGSLGAVVVIGAALYFGSRPEPKPAPTPGVVLGAALPAPPLEAAPQRAVEAPPAADPAPIAAPSSLERPVLTAAPTLGAASATSPAKKPKFIALPARKAPVSAERSARAQNADELPDFGGRR